MSRSRAIESRLEKLVPSLDEYFVLGFKTRAEIRDIVRQRTAHEYKLVARPLCILDVRDAIEFEVELDRQFGEFLSETKLQSKYRWVPLERAQGVFQIAIPRLKERGEGEALAKDYCLFLKRYNRTHALSAFFARELVRHPRNVDMWVEAIQWEIDGLRFDIARGLVQKAVTLLDKEPKIWALGVATELAFMETSAKACLMPPEDAAKSDGSSVDVAAYVSEQAGRLRATNPSLAGIAIDGDLANTVVDTALACAALDVTAFAREVVKTAQLHAGVSREVARRAVRNACIEAWNRLHTAAAASQDESITKKKPSGLSLAQDEDIASRLVTALEASREDALFDVHAASANLRIATEVDSSIGQRRGLSKKQKHLTAALVAKLTESAARTLAASCALFSPGTPLAAAAAIVLAKPAAPSSDADAPVAEQSPRATGSSSSITPSIHWHAAARRVLESLGNAATPIGSLALAMLSRREASKKRGAVSASEVLASDVGESTGSPSLVAKLRQLISSGTDDENVLWAELTQGIASCSDFPEACVRLAVHLAYHLSAGGDTVAAPRSVGSKRSRTVRKQQEQESSGVRAEYASTDSEDESDALRHRAGHTTRARSAVFGQDLALLDSRAQRFVTHVGRALALVASKATGTRKLNQAASVAVLAASVLLANDGAVIAASVSPFSAVTIHGDVGLVQASVEELVAQCARQQDAPDASPSVDSSPRRRLISAAGLLAKIIHDYGFALPAAAIKAVVLPVGLWCQRLNLIPNALQDVSRIYECLVALHDTGRVDWRAWLDYITYEQQQGRLLKAKEITSRAIRTLEHPQPLLDALAKQR